MKTKVSAFVKEKFLKINESMLISQEDATILKIAKMLDFEEELVSAQKNNNDFFTFFTIQENKDIDLLIFSYIGKIDDSGFICFYIPDLLRKKINISLALNAILAKQPLFDKKTIIDTIILDVLTKMNKAVTYPTECRVVRTKDEVYFELFNKSSMN
jgi:hypothetical protein